MKLQTQIQYIGKSGSFAKTQVENIGNKMLDIETIQLDGSIQIRLEIHTQEQL